MTYSIVSKQRGRKALVQEHGSYLVLELWDLEHDELFDSKMIIPEEGAYSDARERLIIQARSYVTGEGVGELLAALVSFENDL